MSKNRNRSFLVAIGLFLLSKFKWAIALLKFTKFGGTLLTMGASLGVYAWAYGWKFAAAIVYLIFVHEMGHIIAAKRKGIATSPAFFIPFVGALISLKEQPRDAATEAYLAYGGPLAGLISFLPAVGIYYFTEEPFWALVIFLGALLNLFNLLPVSPLDGGRIVSVLSSKIWFIGLLILAGILIFSPSSSPILFFILLIGVFTWWGRIREGYKNKLLSYEKEKLNAFQAELKQWPSYSSTIGLKESLNRITKEANGKVATARKWYIPFLHDQEREARDKAKVDLAYAEEARMLIMQWEHQPVFYVDNDPQRPEVSPLLSAVHAKLDERLSIVNEQLERLRTYYVSTPAVKWKVLTAYVALAIVLSLFMIYGQHLMELHQVDL
ncbi:site-2 protease family protein [Paenibacillus swuensis]|uniref:site-2 protease family protein n=1 Tax=Paenibacillus swuensis TaxID=1178515 RepID=UPI000A86BB35|nr:site-2 protease family protein [Paenibacillus swuensis]